MGGNNIEHLFKQYSNGQIKDRTELSNEILRNAGRSAVNKTVGGLSPVIKFPFEAFTSQSLFPDVFNPRAVDRMDLVTGLVGMTEEYKFLRGKVMADGTRSKYSGIDEWVMSKMGVSMSNPRAAALHEVWDAYSTFQDRVLGKPSPSPMTVSPFKAMREAVYADGPEGRKAFEEAFEHWKSKGGTFKSFRGYLDRLGSRVTKEHEKQFMEWLTPRQRTQVGKANDFSSVVQAKMFMWSNEIGWDEANSAEETKYIGNLISRAAGPGNTERSAESRDEAITRMRSMGFSKEEALKRLRQNVIDQDRSLRTREYRASVKRLENVYKER